MTTKPTPTRKPTGRKAERPRQRWRALKVGEVRPPGYQVRRPVGKVVVYSKWGPGACTGIRLRPDDMDFQFRAPVTGKARSTAAARSTATARSSATAKGRWK